jgi:DNA-binding transcriptional ArsR family regulator
MTPKDFYRARSQAEHELRRDGKLSLADRMVGLEIFSYVNRKTGCAYPSQETIAHSLKVDERTVRRAAKHLTAAGYLKVSRRGRHNVYSPILSPRKPDNMSAIDAPAATPDIHDTNTGHSCTNTGHGCTPNLIKNLNKNLGGSLASAPDGARSPREQARIELVATLGWHCFKNIPRDESRNLETRWPNVTNDEILELKCKYG